VRRAAALLLALVLGASVSACGPDDIFIAVSGTLFECNDADVCDPVPDAPLRLLDIEETVRAETVTDADGDFLLQDVPGLSVVFTVAEAPPERVPTVFLGTTGTEDGAIDDGALFVAALDEVQAQIDAFTESHPDGSTVQVIDLDTDGDGGMVRGQFLEVIEGVDATEWPGAAGLSCHFEDDAGAVYPCVYYDSAGEPDWANPTSSSDGRWAAFGLPAGTYTGVVLAGAYGESVDYALFYTHVVEDGLTIFDLFPSPF
jgi:hypothetical protein